MAPSMPALRVSGNLNIAVVQILNAFNVQVQDTTTGLATSTGSSIGMLTTANNVACAAQVTVSAQSGRGPPQSKRRKSDGSSMQRRAQTILPLLN